LRLNTTSLRWLFNQQIHGSKRSHQMHDLHLERLLKEEPGDGPIKTFTLHGIKDSPPYLHDGRALTLEDTVEFFNLVMQLSDSPRRRSETSWPLCASYRHR
jgi:cytochrome c peroxidase